MRIISALFILTLLLKGGGVAAQKPSFLRERMEKLKEVKNERVETKKNLLEQAKDIIKAKIRKQVKGILTTISGSVLTVQRDTDTFTVNVGDKTEIRRKFGGVSELSELRPNDKLLIIGNSNVNKEIDATYIRDLSIQRRTAVFVGEVISIAANSFTLNTVGRGVQTVYVSVNTKYSEREQTITYKDIEIGNKVIVKGELHDRETLKIDAKSVLKLVQKKQSITLAPTQKED